MTDLTFASLGWVTRAAGAVGSDRFAESARRARFYLNRAAGHADTPAERAVIAGMASALDAVLRCDADSRFVLEEFASEIPDICAAEALASLKASEGL